MQLKASAPGSLMLLGEYAVLYGNQALVCAVDRRITVSLSPHQSHQINICSDQHGEHTTDLQQLKVESPFQFVLAVLNHFRAQLPSGCHINIASNFSDKLGLGSSAAVTVATVMAVHAWLKKPFVAKVVLQQSRQIVRTVQGTGSGADVAASVYGGVVLYRASPLTVEPFPYAFPITVLYSGSKVPTVQAIKSVRARFAACPLLFRSLMRSIGECASYGADAVRKKDWAQLGGAMSIQQGLMDALGTNVPQLHQLVTGLRQTEGILGAKISGSGFGDCVIGLGETDKHEETTCLGGQQLAVKMTAQGAQCEKN